MNREDLAVLETKLFMLLRRFEKSKIANEECQARLAEVENELQKKDKMLEDLKVQLDQMHHSKVAKNNSIEVEEVKSELLQLVKEVDDCIKSIQ